MTMIGVIISLPSMLRAFVAHYDDGERQWTMTTMTTKQHQQMEEDVNNESGHREGGAMSTWWASKATCTDTARFVVLL